MKKIFVLSLSLVIVFGALTAIGAVKTKQIQKFGGAISQLFFTEKKSANATSTVSYMTPGRATTTLSVDAYNSSSSGTAFSGLSLAVQITATTGQPILNIDCERSMDGIDWYRGNCYNTSTTTNTANLTVPSSFTWNFASSTCQVGGVKNSATQSSCARVFEIPALTRWTRAVFSFASSTAAIAGNNESGSIWAEFIGIK